MEILYYLCINKQKTLKQYNYVKRKITQGNQRAD